uniref:Uncharacterized protein n=1 Tax=Anopheles stephensi TaxID=30069 RepID=A0A182YEJ0_ANOST
MYYYWLFRKTVLQERHGSNRPNIKSGVIDDWPLYATHGINSGLAIDACYQSSENRRLRRSSIASICV